MPPDQDESASPRAAAGRRMEATARAGLAGIQPERGVGIGQGQQHGRGGGFSGAGGCRRGGGHTRPGRAMASSTARKQGCLSTGSAKPGSSVIRMVAMVKNCTRVAAARRQRARAGRLRQGQRAMTTASSTGPAGVLQQRVQHGGQFCLPHVTARQ